MVVKDFYNLLTADITLSTLLGATVADSKIYPLQMPLDAVLPVVIYKIADEGTLDENINSTIIHYDCISDNYETAKLIQERISELLDIEDAIAGKILHGLSKYLNSRMEMIFNFKEVILDIFHYVISFEINYVNSYGFLLQENGIYLAQENGYNFRIV